MAPLQLPLNCAVLAHLLAAAATGESGPTHQQIADWARRFCNYIRESRDRGTAVSSADEAGCRVAEDIDAQWDLFLFNTFAIEQLRSIDVSLISLPRERFAEWRARLSEGAA